MIFFYCTWHFKTFRKFTNTSTYQKKIESFKKKKNIFSTTIIRNTHFTFRNICLIEKSFFLKLLQIPFFLTFLFFFGFKLSKSFKVSSTILIVILISKCHLQYANYNYINFKVKEQEKVLNTYLFMYNIEWFNQLCNTAVVYISFN